MNDFGILRDKENDTKNKMSRDTPSHTKKRTDTMNAMEQGLKEWQEQLNSLHLPRWEELPDLGLYMDQVITIMEHYLEPVFPEQEKILTPAMINNYVKLRMIPKPDKKKYGREHLAYLVAITILKQVLTIQEVRDGIVWQAEKMGAKQAYNLFCEEQERVLRELFESQGTSSFPSTERLALRMAVQAFASKRMAEKMIELEYSQKR